MNRHLSEPYPRTDWSTATTNLTPAQARELFNNGDFYAWCVDQLYRHADRLMNGAPVEVPVTDLDEWRERSAFSLQSKGGSA